MPRPEGRAIVEFRLGWAAWTAHDEGVAALLVILLVVVLLATFAAEKRPARAAEGAGAARRNTSKLLGNPYWLLGAALLAVVLLRFGVNALVVAGGMLLATLRALVPLLRFLPLFESMRQRPTASGRTGPGSSGDGQSSARRAQRMTRQEALQVFGLDENASPEDVQREYRRLMRKIHPDLGGSSYLAAKINEAKDVLS